MKILFADKFLPEHLREIATQGHECAYKPELTGDDLAAEMTGVEALIVRSTKVDATAIAAGRGLKLIIRAGVGTNTIDKNAAAARGVHVCNVPGRNAIAVAELAMGLLLAIDRNIPDNVAELRTGRWDKQRFSAARGLYGRNLGIVGLGAIGLALAERAAAFGLKIHVIEKPGRAADVSDRLDAVGAVGVADLDAMADACDILSFHVPAAPETKGLIGRALLDRLQPGSIIINTARGDVVDEVALLDALDNKGLRAGLDVYPDEPAAGRGAFDSKLAGHPNVYGTHHIGASTEQAQIAVAEGVVEILAAFANGEIRHCVNQPVSQPDAA